MKILHIVGARPNYMKIAPLMSEISLHPEYFSQALIHTGQHYDTAMSDVFFSDLEMPYPDENLDVGSGSHATQTAKIMLAFEPIVIKYKPDLVFVVGDVNSTLACALVCSKLGIKIAHIEAGLRSKDMTMPEEINRILTDHISDLLFTPSAEATTNLLNEGVSAQKIKFVGNIMIDTLIKYLSKIEYSKILAELNLKSHHYILVTLHRPANVDDHKILETIIVALQSITEKYPVVFVVHPRTKKRINEIDTNNIKLIEPLGYINFLALMKSALLVITDSGGIQEETTFLNIPCLTIRKNTERQITIDLGTNQLIENTVGSIVDMIKGQLEQPKQRISIPDLWDGHTSYRIVDTLMNGA